MPLTIPTILTIFRIALIPVLVLVFYLDYSWSNIAATAIFALGALTDWADGYIARRFSMASSFGAFLDPVADKLAVTTALLLIVQQHHTIPITLISIVIIGREIMISALREWMAQVGRYTAVRVATVGKLKTIAQMVALGMMLYREPLGPLPVFLIGETLLFVAAVLTLWSGFSYLQAARIAIRSDSPAPLAEVRVQSSLGPAVSTGAAD